MDAGVLFQGVVWRGLGWGHGRCSVKVVLGTGGVCEIYHCHFRGILH